VRGKILVVDDEPLILKTIERALGKKGYEVRVTPDARSFLDALREDSADLLIMDLNLGELDSRSLLGSIREISPGSRILTISGVLQDDMRGGLHFLEKPFRIEELRDKVREILNEG
jgi:DNA-binding response OmpR family regulator